MVVAAAARWVVVAVVAAMAVAVVLGRTVLMTCLSRTSGILTG